MAKELTYESIMSDLSNRIYKPIYYLMGEESYFIDKISEYIEEHVLTDEEKSFNQVILYGSDTETDTIINAAKRYPMMAERQVVIVREAQQLKSLDESLSYYLQNPQSKTILVFCHKHGKLDRRKKIVAEIEKKGVLFESKKLKDNQIPDFTQHYLQLKSIQIDRKASEMLAEFVGTDLSKLVNELDKLVITLPHGNKLITPDQIEQNIGISKDYNNFELKDALVRKDIYKANRIIDYFARNPKSNPIQVTIALLFSFFANLMLAYYAPDKSDRGVASYLGLKSPYAANDYLKAMRMYSGRKVMDIIGYLRECDAASKGFNNPNTQPGDLLRELIFKILH